MNEQTQTIDNTPQVEQVAVPKETDLQAKIRAAKDRYDENQAGMDESMLANDPLSLPQRIRNKYQTEKVHLCWVNDLPGNIASFIERGYFEVEEIGVETKRYGGVGRDNKAYQTVLMGIPQELFDKERAREQAIRDQEIEEIRSGKTLAGASKGVDTSGIEVRQAMVNQRRT